MRELSFGGIMKKILLLGLISINAYAMDYSQRDLLFIPKQGNFIIAVEANLGTSSYSIENTSGNEIQNSRETSEEQTITLGYGLSDRWSFGIKFTQGTSENTIEYSDNSEEKEESEGPSNIVLGAKYRILAQDDQSDYSIDLNFTLTPSQTGAVDSSLSESGKDKGNNITSATYLDVNAVLGKKQDNMEGKIFIGFSHQTEEEEEDAANSNLISTRDAQSTLYAGGGFQFNTSDSFSLFAEAQYILMTKTKTINETSGNFTSSGEADPLLIMGIMAGLKYQLNSSVLFKTYFEGASILEYDIKQDSGSSENTYTVKDQTSGAINFGVSFLI